MRKSKGITLIALVITIIVLLILAGISIASLTGENGILGKAEEASKKTKDVAESEQVKFAIYSALADETGTLSTENVRKALENEFGADNVTDDTFTGDGPWFFTRGKKNYVIDIQGNLQEKNILDRTGLKVGDYINYQPDENQEIYSKVTPQNTGFSYEQSLGTQSSFKQEKLNWRILKIYNNGNIDIIGDPTTTELFLQGSLGYNNGVFILNDLCETLYSKKSAGMKARSVRLNDIENYLTDDGKIARSNYANINSKVKYDEIYKYSYEEGKIYYPDIYKYEINSGITGTIRTEGIKMSEIYKGYANGLTDKIGEKSGQNGLAIKQTFYMIDVNEENFGEVADVLNYSAGYWMSSRVINCDNDDKGGRFSISCVNNSKVDAVTLVCSGMDNAQGLWRFSIRPVITLYSDIEIENSIGINNADNPHSIVKY